MLPFLANPHSFTEHPLGKRSLDYLRAQPQPTAISATMLIFSLVAIVVLLFTQFPLFMPITSVKRAYMVYLPIVGLHLIASLHTALCAAILYRTEEDNVWENLIVTGVSAREIVISRWWAVVRFRWVTHAWVGILAYIGSITLWSYFELIAPIDCPWGWNAWCWGYANDPKSLPELLLLINRPLLIVILSLGLSGCLILLNVVLAAAFGSWLGLQFRTHKLGVAQALSLQAVIPVAAYFVMLSSTALRFIPVGSDYYRSLYRIARVPNLVDSFGSVPLESLQIMCSYLIDGGLLLLTRMFSSSFYFQTFSTPALWGILRVALILFCLVLFGFCTLLLLRMGISAAQRQGACKP